MSKQIEGCPQPEPAEFRPIEYRAQSQREFRKRITAARNQDILRLFQAGETVEAIAIRFKLSTGYVERFLRDNGVRIPYSRRTAFPEKRKLARPQRRSASYREARNAEIAKKFKSGMTQGELAKEYGVTRQNISLILLQRGLHGKDGGLAVTAEQRAAEREKREQARKDQLASRRNKSAMRIYGCDWATAKALNGSGGLSEKGTPSRKYVNKRNSAKRINGRWELTFPEWMRLWEGKEDQTGTGSHDLVAMRKDPKGPFRLDNMYVCEKHEAIVELRRKERVQRDASVGQLELPFSEETSDGEDTQST